MNALVSRQDDRQSVRRWAWGLGIVVVLFYVGYYVLNWLRGAAS